MPCSSISILSSFKPIIDLKGVVERETVAFTFPSSSGIINAFPVSDAGLAIESELTKILIEVLLGAVPDTVNVFTFVKGAVSTLSDTLNE